MKDEEDMQDQPSWGSKIESHQDWDWPDKTVYFFSDLHGDPDAFVRSLLASGGVELQGTELALTEAGLNAKFIIGGDTFDKGPYSLGLLDSIKGLIDTGADVDIIAGNHDFRILLAATYAGTSEKQHSHFLVRIGKKSLPVLKEICDRYGMSSGELQNPERALMQQVLFPASDWAELFHDQAREWHMWSEASLEKEVKRVFKKERSFEDHCQELNLTLGDVWAAVCKAKELFVHSDGEYRWFFDRIKLASKVGSFLFVHAGICDVMSRIVRLVGVDGVNDSFKSKMADGELAKIYYGPYGNMFRTKYREVDFPFTKQAKQDLNAIGVHAIMHGHRNLTSGQQSVVIEGMPNFLGDCSVDRATREKEGLEGPGHAVTVIKPDRTIVALSADHPGERILAG